MKAYVVAGWILVLCLVEPFQTEASSAPAWEFLKGSTETVQFRRQPFFSQPRTVSLTSTIIVPLPTPEGSFESFEIRDAELFPPELAEKFPEIKVFYGKSLADPQETVRLEVTDGGVTAWVRNPAREYYIRPFPQLGTNVHRVFFGDGISTRLQECRPLFVAPRSTASFRQGTAVNSGNTLRVFRIALATTGEFTQLHGGTKSGAMAAVATILNRVNGIFESELAVRLELIPNNDQVIYLDPTTDPYTRTEASEWTITQNHTNLTTVIGTANFDLGMLFNTALYGLAYLRSVCDPNLKGRGVIGTDTTSMENFYRVVAHEIGHQFGANHPFNGNQGHCNLPRNGWTAYEPGSGSTLMAYAGIGCLNDELQPINDTYFHSENYEEIQSFLGGAACARLLPTGNRAPSVSTPLSYSIPKGTPFALTATGTDPDNDPLLFCWEQIDLGPAQSLIEPDNGASPLFRSFPPTNSPIRYFPRLEDLLANRTSLSEKLPETNRFLHFQVLVRDQRTGGGGVAMANMEITVVGNQGPFILIAPNGGEQWSGAQTVRWNPAGTTQSPVNANQVHILLSTNGGRTFNQTLASNTPNDGVETVTLPAISASNARIKLMAANNIFFDISNNDFQLVGANQDIRIRLSRIGNSVRLRWDSIMGRRYRVQALDQFSQNWFDLVGELIGNGGELEKTEPLPALGTRYFRIALLP